ncbi:MAG: hypothetical protein JRN34_04570 [Nitrososphaerota archaeon]|nr:hypothetical protein [Nitrososphaerota archaeon]MDG6942182.1 hypothetical protein [Nitrososphaerota archaeon]MDG6942647.1 hypothetical protein [Nitrososphaerota archaeon]MDG6948434.1 hypothetical protein [Nitrososphaerota archaeon]MDG6950360.1 hypothetical protein [Nitrososphaerota archaeon]
MSESVSVREYLTRLDRTKEGKGDEAKEGLAAFISLWERAISNGVVGESDSVDLALEKLEKAGGLYRAAGN